MKKNQETTKEPLGTFVQIGKVPVAARIKLLIGERSVRKAAEDWGINPETIRNYFKRKNSKPRYEVLEKISKSERVSIDWILHGTGENSTKDHSLCSEEQIMVQDSTNRLWAVLSVLTDYERERLADVLLRKGAETVLYLLDEDNIDLLKLDRVIKDKLLGKHYPEDDEQAALNDAKARECGFDNEGEKASVNLTDRLKQAV